MNTNKPQLDLSNLTPQQRRKLEKLAKIIDEGDIAILEHLLEIEDRIEETSTKIDRKIPDLDNVLRAVKGKDGEDGKTPKKGIDYQTDDEIEALKIDLLKISTPIKGSIIMMERMEEIR